MQKCHCENEHEYQFENADACKCIRLSTSCIITSHALYAFTMCACIYGYHMIQLIFWTMFKPKWKLGYFRKNLFKVCREQSSNLSWKPPRSCFLLLRLFHYLEMKMKVKVGSIMKVKVKNAYDTNTLQECCALTQYYEGEE